MRRRHTLYLEDILESVKNIMSYVGSLSYDDLMKDRMRVDAVVRNFEIIGEASGKITQEIRDKYSFVEWQKMADFRNVLSHEYFGINYKIMWDVIKNKLPALEKQIKSIIDQEQAIPSQ